MKICSENALSPADIEKAHAELSRWASPADFSDAVERWKALTDAAQAFRSPKLQFLLEAWVLSKFAQLRPVDKVRLSDPREEWPDGYVERHGICFRAEVVSMDLPGRRIGDEYKDCDLAVWRPDPVENWIARADAIPAALETGLAKKASKRYASSFILVAYLNLGTYGMGQQEIEQEIAIAKARHAPMFEQIWVLWDGKLF